ncbi:post-transcriptional regulator [Paenibacillus sp. FSL H7-0331]|uniref:post-transcriptional regulator n=1 Tax=Paenibacillus sp. FSL H7-0331 TaxID=1920421 RepID=UPI0026C2EE9B|nr:post-transcriptional regulator [Paenibacillus sp. FSL H7-0331]
MEHDGRKEEQDAQHSEDQTKQETIEQKQTFLELTTETELDETAADVQQTDPLVIGQEDIPEVIMTNDDVSDDVEELEDGEELEAFSSEELDEEPVTLSEMELNELIESICTSKAEEFRMIGYEHVTGREIWECVSDKYQKTGMPALHQIVNDILSLKVTKFMNWMTMSIYKSNPFA